MSTVEKPHRRGHGRVLLAAVALAGLGAAGFAYAASHGALPAFHHPHGAAMRLHAEFVVDRALRKAEATDDQRRQIEAIVERVFNQHRALRTRHQEMREELHAVLTADSIDRDRLEALRTRHLQLIEEGSRQLTQAIADAAEVLSVEQRRELVEWAHSLHE